MKRISVGIITIMIILTNICFVRASVLEKGNPIATYTNSEIILPNNNVVMINDNYTALFVNGSLVTDYDIIIRNNRSLVPVRLISEQLGANIQWDDKNRLVTIKNDTKTIVLTIDRDIAIVDGKEINLDYPATIYKDYTYVPLRFVAENLDATVEYSEKIGTGYKKFYDTQMPVSSEKTIVREYNNIIIDEKYDAKKAISKSDAEKNVKKLCLDGLESFKKNMSKTDGLLDQFHDDFNLIEKDINRMIYLGEVSRYYKFTIGAYDILYDKYNQNMFFEIYSYGVKVKSFDINDPELYTLIYIVG